MSVKKKVLRLISFLLEARATVTKANIVSLNPNQLLKGRCALITGGTSGIGYAIAEAFLKAGAIVVITGRNKERLDCACNSLSKYGVILGCELDNTKILKLEDNFMAILNKVSSYSKYIDILVNNAGIGVGRSYPNTAEEDYDLVMSTNLKGSYFLSQLFGKYLVKNNIKGNILNIESSSSLRFGNSPYVISKWGMKSLTLGLAKTLAPYGITVNAIAPGPTATPMLKQESTDNITKINSLLGRWILPEEIANGAVFLVSDMGRSVIGDTIYMTGGAGLLTQDDVPYNFSLV